MIFMMELPIVEAKRRQSISEGKETNCPIIISMVLHYEEAIQNEECSVSSRSKGPDIEKILRIKSRLSNNQNICTDEFIKAANADISNHGASILREVSIKFESETLKLFEISFGEGKNEIETIPMSVCDQEITVMEDLQDVDANRTTGWYIDYEDISDVGDLIGFGSFGTVYVSKLNGQQVAVKKFIRQRMREHKLFSLISEIMIHRFRFLRSK